MIEDAIQDIKFNPSRSINLMKYLNLTFGCRQLSSSGGSITFKKPSRTSSWPTTETSLTGEPFIQRGNLCCSYCGVNPPNCLLTSGLSWKLGRHSMDWACTGRSASRRTARGSTRPVRPSTWTAWGWHHSDAVTCALGLFKMNWLDFWPPFSTMSGG